MKKLKFLLWAVPFFAFAASAAVGEESIENLLAGYLKNDLTLQNLSAEVAKQILNNESVQISNGMSFKLSTGSVTLYTGDTTYATLTPSASLSFPQYNDLTFSLSSKTTVGSSDAGFSNTSISVQSDIISEKSDDVSISLLKSQRNLLESQRQLQNRFTSAEKEFYSNLKSLYQLAAEITSAEKNLYEDKLSFEEIKALGYSTTSSKYRSAQLEVLSDQHTVDTKKHQLERETKIFASLCGIEYTGSDAATDFLPSKIPSVEAIDILSFAEENYTELESALWTKKINQAERDAQKTFSLSANAGYTFANSNTNTGNSKKADTVDLGTNFTWQNSGLSASAGVSIPVTSENHSPIFTFAFSLDPSAFQQAKISSQIDQLESEQEDISIQSAKKSYQTAVTSQQAELADIQWNKSSNTETYNLYTSLAADLKNWYKRGITTESEWRSAEVNKENYRIQLLINDIDLIIYNNETTLLFTRDEELLEKKEAPAQEEEKSSEVLPNEEN